MIVNETLPVISDQVLGGGVSAVAVSTVLIVIFSEIIPQSICTRYGLYIGAKCAIPVRILMYSMYIVAWPVSKLLETVLGPHHGIIYRRGELKELINMHSSVSPHGGDLKHDTVAIIGHTLDLQEKVVKDAMTPIASVFMLPLDARLDYATLRKVCESGHSRVPVYEEIEVPVYKDGDGKTDGGKVKKIVGILLVKQCVLLDPKEATPVRSIPLNKVPSVPFDESLLGILDRFQEGRSHMAIVSLFSKGRAASVKEAVKLGLTRRFLNRVGLGEDGDEESEGKKNKDLEKAWGDLREGKIGGGAEEGATEKDKETVKRFRASIEGREQAMPADAVLASENADDFLRGIDTEINPLGIITLEDVLEELIGEEILDEFDLTGPQAPSSYVPPSAKRAAEEQCRRFQAHSGSPTPSATLTAPAPAVTRGAGLPTLQFPRVPSGLNIFSRARSQPGTPRVEAHAQAPDYMSARDKEKELGDEVVNAAGVGVATDGGIVPEPVDNDTATLRATLTSETDTTAVWGPRNQDITSVPNILVSDEHGQPASMHQQMSSAPIAPRVTEAILQTQTRRRAHLQQQAQSQSAISLPVPTASGSLATGGDLQLPAQRPGKGRFKSSPLAPMPPRAAEDKDKGGETIEEDGKKKVVEPDPNLRVPKGGL
ncbi:hypothetical protein JB92DRAFT_2998552 [Gautieria morchelliformis]|nr:hypothetical protein JB92DRAFT_2998552 [Gautieria morchelliformis]